MGGEGSGWFNPPKGDHTKKKLTSIGEKLKSKIKIKNFINKSIEEIDNYTIKTYKNSWKALSEEEKEGLFGYIMNFTEVNEVLRENITVWNEGLNSIIRKVKKAFNNPNSRIKEDCIVYRGTSLTWHRVTGILGEKEIVDDGIISTSFDFNRARYMTGRYANKMIGNYLLNKA
ncbi:ADP-ribosyltransferase [Candidatus Pacearchaeota archaeon]|jgi:hypothetical protein|nr:ADP-ribosyltransferase [Candidatus Pacearchaeota archaeon]